MTDDITPQKKRRLFLLPVWGGSHLTWVIIGGGFLLGMLFGAILLVGRSEEPAVSSSAAVPSTTPDSQSSLSSATPATAERDPASGELTAERDRLRQELEAEKLRREVETLRRELTDLKTSPVSVASERRSPSHNRSSGVPAAMRRAASRPPSRSAAGSVSAGEATLAYWNRVNAIILQEAAIRSSPAGGITASNAAGFLDARVQAAEFAVNSLRQLDTAGVDSRVVTLSRKLAGWYDDGFRVAVAGKQLMSGASIQERQGSTGKKYQASERSHSQSVNAINAEGEQVRQAMSRKYRFNFPPLN